jgi:hypothetical protein
LDASGDHLSEVATRTTVWRVVVRDQQRYAAIADDPIALLNATTRSVVCRIYELAT